MSKKLICLLTLLVCLLVPCVSFADTVYTGYVNDQQVPVYLINPEIMTLVDTEEGYGFSWAHKTAKGTGAWNWVSGESLGYKVAVGTEYYVAQVKLTESFSRTDTYDFKLMFTANFDVSNPVLWTIDNTGTVEQFDGTVEMSKSGSTYTLDVKNVEGSLSARYLRFTFDGYSSSVITPTLTYKTLALEKVDGTKGLIAGIIELVRNIKDGVLNLAGNIASSLASFFQAIVNKLTDVASSIVNKLADVLAGIKNALVTLLNGIIQGLKDLFIPSSEFFSNYFDDLYNFFVEKLGFLSLPFTIIIDLVEAFASVGTGSGVINIPNLSLFGQTIIQSQTYDLQGALTTTLGNFYNIYYAFVDCIVYLGFINFVKKKFDSIQGIIGGK